jgi:hypothetical protein
MTETTSSTGKSARDLGSFEELLREHQARFACHVCGTASSGPFCGDGAEGEFGDEACSWDIPRDLVRCEVCQRWCCEIHFRNFGYEAWWVCIVCFLDLSARIAAEAGDSSEGG